MIAALAVWAALAVPVGDGSVPAGTTIHSVYETRLDLELDIHSAAGHQQRQIVRRHRQISDIDRLADGFAITWQVNRHVALEPGHEHDRVLPVVGHRYLVTDAIRRADGSTPTAEEREVVGQIDMFNQLSTLQEMLGDDPSVGASFAAGPMFAGLLADAPGVARLVDGTLTLAEIAVVDGRETAVVHLALSLRAEGEDARGAFVVTEVEVGGSAAVDVATGWTTRLELAGAVSVEATRASLHTTGAGAVSSSTVLEVATL